MKRFDTVRMVGLAALLGSVAMYAHAQPVAAPAPIASDAALIAPPPAPIPDGIALPPTMPDVNAPAAPTPADSALPTVPGLDNASPPEPSDMATSPEPAQPLTFDDFGSSVFYKQGDISKLKTALDIADAVARRAAQGITKVEEAIMPTPEAPKIEISEYPVFHLSSVVYQGQGKWVIWLNGNRTTSKTLPPDLSVIGINTQQVRFAWKPQIMPALKTRWQSEEGDASKTKLKKLLSGANLVAVDEKGGGVNFTLRPNQTYSSAYNAVLEGKQAPVSVGGDSGTIDVSAFEQTLRDAQQSGPATRPSTNNMQPSNRMPRVVRPDRVNASRQPGAPALGSNVPATQQPAPRRSGLVTPDAATIGQVPSIFPGGVPASANPRSGRTVVTPAMPDPGLPILPPGAQ